MTDQPLKKPLADQPTPFVPGNRVTDEELELRFSYHPPTLEQIHRIQVIRAEALKLARMIRDFSPVCREQSTALTELDHVVQDANSAIVRREP